MAISNDKEFKAALAGLSGAQQRQVAARFVQRVFPLSNDVRVKAALDVALRPDISDAELTVVAAAANSARVESFTQCGKETDWGAQAGHFVAKAAVACVSAASPGASPAWDAAMQARMAKTCETVATGEGTENREAEEQYRILEDFMK
jgi:hypothetical protein